MQERRRDARTAGLWYLAMAVTGPIGILVAPGQILVRGDAGATAANVVAHETLLRIGVVASVACQVAFLLTVLALERLFDGVSPRLLRLMHVLVVAGVPLAIANEIWPLAAMELVRAPGGLGVEHAQALALQAMTLHGHGLALVGTFWGLWLLPLGVLVMRSGFIPGVIGVLLLAAGGTYLVDSALWLLAPAVHRVIASVLPLPTAVGELSMVVWLLVWGVKERRDVVSSAPTSS